MRYVLKSQLRILSHGVVLGAALILTLGVGVAQADPEVLPIDPPRAMWVWDAKLLVKPQERDQLLAFCDKEKIVVLYLAAYNIEAPMDRFYREFNRICHEKGIQVHALAGDPRWGKTRYHELPLAWVRQILEFNEKSSDLERFDGIHTDVEVYLLSKSWEEKPAELLGGYLDLNAKMAQLIREHPQPILFGVDVPFWFDDDTNYRILWHGNIKPPSHHVLDTVDTMTVMAYRNFAEGSDGTVRLVWLELTYANEIGKKIVIGQETQENLYPPYVTFGNTSCSAMRKEMEKVQKVVGGHRGFGGFAIHHYESYKKLCSQ